MKTILLVVVFAALAASARADLKAVPVTLPDGKLVWVYVTVPAKAAAVLPAAPKSKGYELFEKNSERTNREVDRALEEYIKGKK